MNPSHKSQISRLNRAIGQLEAIGRMIDEGRYCVEILTQLRAARSAVKCIELEILQTHMGSCMSEALASNDEQRKLQSISEIMGLLKKYE